MDRYHTSKPIACSLDAAEMRTRTGEWASLVNEFRRWKTTSSGATLWFDPAAEGTVRSLAVKEAACCGFLRLDAHTENDAVRLDITSDQPDARFVIDQIVQLASGGQETP